MTNRIIATVLAASIAFTGMSTAPARADSGEIGRLLLGAGALFIIGSAISNSNRDRDRVVTRRNDPVIHQPRVQPRFRRVLPGDCLRRNQWDNGPSRYFGRNCLSRRVEIRRLPRQCKRTVWTNRGQRTVFAARCLRKNGWVIG